MTNEELVLKIQEGKVELLTDLWFQVEKFVRKRAFVFATNKFDIQCARAGITSDDLYQAGYFALEPAALKYKPEPGTTTTFIYFFALYLHRQFYKEMRLSKRGEKYYNVGDTLCQLDTVSFENVIIEDTTLESLLPDESAQQPFLDLENKLYNEQLRADLELAIANLRPRDAAIIRNKYFDHLTDAVIAEGLSISPTLVRSLRAEALKVLRKHKSLQAYREDLLHRSGGAGYTTWYETGMSQQERFLIKLEAYEEQLGLKPVKHA